MQTNDGSDPYSPPQIARLVQDVGVRKTMLPALPLFTLGVLAGAFIAFGAMFYTIIVTGSALGFGITRLLGGLGFSVGLVLVLIGGAELFTGNNLIVMAWAAGKVTSRALLRNWIIVYAGNLAGAVGSAVLVLLSGILRIADGAVGAQAAAIAASKIALSPTESFTRGILCNTLVCLAVWLCYASRQVSGKILAIVFPISAFVALGFEHSVANMYLLPVGMLAGGGAIDGPAILSNLLTVTLGNIVGGSVLVALVYWAIYLREPDE